MWTSTISTSDLEDKGKWKVEIFSGDGKSTDSMYDMVSVGKVVQRRGESISTKEYPSYTFNYLSLGNIETLSGDLVDFEPILGDDVKSRTKIFRKNDVLYGRLRPQLNKVYLAENPVYEGVCSSEFIVMMPDTSLVKPRYLRAILASDYVSSLVGSLETGSTHPRLQREDLMDLEIPLPPMDVQKKIDAFIKEKNERRRRIAREVEAMPQALNDALIRSLQKGEELEVDIPSPNVEPFENPLPPEYRK